MNGARVLIVEDESIVAMDIASDLDELGYQVVGTAETGEQAVALARSEDPDLVLMDIVLKGKMDGIEAARQIERAQKAPVVFLTAHSDEGTLKRARLAKPYGYVLKPFDESELRTAIELALYRKSDEAAAGAAKERPRRLLNEHGQSSGIANLEVLNTHEIFRLVDPFAMLPKEDRQGLAATSQYRLVKQGEYLVYEGDRENCSFIVLSGRFASIKASTTGKELIVDVLVPGNVHVEGDFRLRNGVSPTSIRAQIESKIIVLDSQSVQDCFNRYPELYETFVDRMSESLRRSHEFARSLAHESVEKRIIGALMMLQERMSGAGVERPVSIDITRQELAHLAGTTPETAIRVTKAMERRQVLDLSTPGEIIVRDQAALESYSTGDSGTKVTVST